MAHHGDRISEDQHIFLRLPNGSLKPVECKSNQIIELGKLGSIPVNSLLGRPFYHTYEIQEKAAEDAYPVLRVVPPSELNAEILASDAQGVDLDTNGDVDINAAVLATVKDNRLTIDDGSRQTLTHDEIEQLKRTTDGKIIIEKILANHTALDEKTDFSRAKYTMRKAKKYLKRFTALPMEIGYLIEFILEKEPMRILDLREETLGLLASWSNAHWHAVDEVYSDVDGQVRGSGRLLVIDDTGGLVVAALAERMGILRRRPAEVNESDVQVDGQQTLYQHKDFPRPATANTLTVIHSAAQANISLLKYFGYDSNNLDGDHPLHTHLKCLSWLQLLHPHEDPLYKEPELLSEDVLREMKAGKRGAYHKKRRRWERNSYIGDEARAGAFDGLVIASRMDLVSVLARAIPLLRGGAPVVIYSPTIEPMTRIMDHYSKERRTAYLIHLLQHGEPPDSEDFTLDPRLLLAPTLQTSRIREYQVLPGRTHPLMTGRGGSEGYIFTAQRVIPVAGGVEARGNLSNKKRRPPSSAEAMLDIQT